MLIAWAKGGQLGRRGQGYQAILEFPVACGITVGTPVRIRGVQVGGVLAVQPSLEKVSGQVAARVAEWGGDIVPAWVSPCGRHAC